MDILQKLQELYLLFKQQKNKIKVPADFLPLIKKFDFTLEEFTQYLLYPSDLPYGRCMVYQSPNFEVILMNWKPRKSSNIHDHGNSFGCVYILSGDVNNVAYDKNIQKIGTYKLTKGNYVEVPKGIFHQIENLNDDFSVSLHFYAPPIVGMKVVDSEDISKAYIVKPECGAWNPDDENIVRTL